jgi:MoaA/NifB/PqqE/SkfB family radical SAM enzyme
MMDPMIVQTFDATIYDTFSLARKLVSGTGLLPAAVRTLKNQRKAAKVRKQWRREGLHIPPLVIFSVTRRCNLRCKGCYHHAQHRVNSDLTIERIDALFDEATELGVSVVVLAGGEPLVRRELLDVVAGYPDILFPVFTNGLLIDRGLASRFRENRNIVPIISIEGYQDYTDGRRGEGVYEEAMERFKLLDEEDVFFGASITVTKENFETVTSDEFVRNLCERGAQVIVYVEYVPVERGTEHLVLTNLQRERLGERLGELRAGHFALFINFPGDEESLGGCLAAGRGFIHISQDGSVEPCPASPFSDTNLKQASLKEALSSKFLEAIRNEPHSLEDSPNGCALFDKEDWIRSLLQR